MKNLMRSFLLLGMLICLISSFSLGEGNTFYLDGECSLDGDGKYYKQRVGTSEDLNDLWVECWSHQEDSECDCEFGLDEEPEK